MVQESPRQLEMSDHKVEVVFLVMEVQIPFLQLVEDMEEIMQLLVVLVDLVEEVERVRPVQLFLEVWVYLAHQDKDTMGEVLILYLVHHLQLADIMEVEVVVPAVLDILEIPVLIHLYSLMVDQEHHHLLQE